MGHDIAIVGISCRFPGASNPDALWELLRAGTDTITRFDARHAPGILVRLNWPCRTTLLQRQG